MLTKLWDKRKSIVLTWLMSYLAVLFIPVLISIVIYYESSRALRGEIQRANDTLLRQVQDVMDQEIENVVRLGVELIWDNHVQTLMYSNRSDSEMAYTAFEVAEMLRQKKSSSVFADEFYIYWEAGHSVLLPGGMRDRELAFESIHQDRNWRYDDWLSLMRRKSYKGFVPIVRTSSGVALQSLAYVNSMPAGKDQGSVGSVVILIDSERLVRTLQNVQQYNGGEVFILNGDGQILASNSKYDEQTLSFSGRMTGDRAFFYDRYHGVDSEVLFIRSRKEELQYVSIMPSRLVWEKAEYVRNFTYASIAVSLLGAGILTFIFLRRHYKPVHRLVEALSGEYGQRTETERESNEFRWIQRAIADTLSERRQIRSRLHTQNRVMRSNTLVRMLKGKLDGHVPIDEALSTFDISFISDDYAVILLDVENGEDFLERIPGDDAQAKLRLQQFIMTNVVEELVGRRHVGYVVEIDEGLACLVNLRQPYGSGEETLVRLADEAREFLSRTFHIELTIAISGVHHTYGGIAQAYQQAKDALEYKIVMGKREIISYEKLQREVLVEAESGYFYPLTVEQQLINYMKIGDFAQASAVLETIRERNFGDKVCSLPIIKCLMFNLVSTMIRTINESGEPEESFFVNKPNRIEAIIRCETIQDMYDHLNGLLREVCCHMAAKLEQQAQQSRSHTLQELTREIERFVETHYADINLNISLIGEQFGMHAGYISRLFKEQTGQGLLDTINRIRVRQAKELLAGGTVGIQEAARRSGFNEVATFIRVFKKFEGITPGKFKGIR
ncbi:MAG: helix-turn-helix domain-containing protein [Paenibacillaceae bacterium]|nr:helix-turn-helix domain-containing protein [Paenibacillaceae bacterium]